MKELIKKSWNYTLSEVQGTLKLSVLAGSVGMYEIDIVLQPHEEKEFRLKGEKYIDELAELVRSNPGAFRSRVNK